MSQWLNAIEDYLQRPTDSALMLEGEWGSGKTYGIRKQVLPMIRNFDLKPIYVSLFGISTIDQLSISLLSSAWMPKLKESRVGQSVSELGKVLYFAAAANPQIMKGYKLPTLKVNFENFLYLTQKSVLIFDDLERCNIPNTELLGFLNRFLEQDNLKIIMIANEKKIKDEHYREVKEKLVRLTIKFTPNLDALLPTIINDVTSSNSLIGEKLVQSLNNIVDFCSKSAIANIRTLKHALSLFVNAMSKISPAEWGYIQQNEFESILNFTIAITNEAMLGNGAIKDFILYTNHDSFEISYHFERNAKKRNNEELDIPYIVKFVEKYFNTTHSFVFSNPILRYVLYGVIDKNALREEIVTLINSKLRPSKSDLLRSYHWHLLSDQEFKEALSDLRILVREGNLSIPEYTTICILLLNVYHKGIAHFSLTDLKDDLLTGMEISKNNINFNALTVMQHSNHTLPEFNDDELEVYKSILNNANSILETLRFKKYEDRINKIRSNWDEYFDDFIDGLYSNGNMIQDVPFLSLLGDEFLYSKIKALDNERIYKVRGHLEERFKYVHALPAIKNEISTIDALMNHLKEYCVSQPRSLKMSLIEDMYNRWFSLSLSKIPSP